MQLQCSGECLCKRRDRSDRGPVIQGFEGQGQELRAYSNIG